MTFIGSSVEPAGGIGTPSSQATFDAAVLAISSNTGPKSFRQMGNHFPPVSFATAMCSEPVLLCLDEPAAGLNARESGALNELLLAIRADHGTSILLIEHDMSVVMEISDHVVVMDYGVKISEGTPQQIRDDPRVIAAYLGADEETALAVMEGQA